MSVESLSNDFSEITRFANCCQCMMEILSHSSHYFIPVFPHPDLRDLNTVSTAAPNTVEAHKQEHCSGVSRLNIV